ncbi:MAG: hypothetical protein KC561_03230 [Myxococcales bacterium]|nr:hypothetical protein [Myxococcales bacterium]
MTIARSFGPAAEEMKSALEKYSKEELIDLMTHIVKTYVVEGTLPLKSEPSKKDGEEGLAELSFTQLISHLQMRLDHKEWDFFSVSGGEVFVTVRGQRLALSDRPAPIPDPPPRSATIETAPVSPPSRPSAASTEQPRSEPSEDRGADSRPDVPPDPFSADAEESERFGMLEID